MSGDTGPTWAHFEAAMLCGERIVLPPVPLSRAEDKKKPDPPAKGKR